MEIEDILQKNMAARQSSSHKQKQLWQMSYADKQALGGSVPPLSTSSACHHPQPENIPFLLASLVGKRLEMRLFWDLCGVCACVCVCLLVINGGSSNICSFSFWHKTRSQSFLARIHQKFWAPSFLAAWLMWLRNGFRHFNTSKTDYCIHKQLPWRCAHTD